MKSFCILMLFFSVAAEARSKVTSYTGSTPANVVVRTFLGIPLQDSIDFIRWQLTLDDDLYELSCNYGLCKANTDGFVDGGSTARLSGAVTKEKNYYKLANGKIILSLLEVNADLLHILDEHHNLLIGNGGWSYTLNNLKPVGFDKINIVAKNTVIKDSITFEGRTPCKVPGVIPAGKLCYKLKWLITLYADKETIGAGTYKLHGTPYRRQGGLKGTWKIITEKDGRIMYQLNDKRENDFLYLLKLDEHILVFTDKQDKLLVGDKDFSYTLNRVERQ